MSEVGGSLNLICEEMRRLTWPLVLLGASGLGYVMVRGNSELAIVVTIAIFCASVISVSRPPMAVLLIWLAILNPSALLGGRLRLGPLELTNVLALLLLSVGLLSALYLLRTFSWRNPSRWFVLLAILTVLNVPRADYAASALTFSAIIAMVTLYLLRCFQPDGPSLTDWQHWFPTFLILLAILALTVLVASPSSLTTDGRLSLGLGANRLAFLLALLGILAAALRRNVSATLLMLGCLATGSGTAVVAGGVAILAALLVLRRVMWAVAAAFAALLAYAFFPVVYERFAPTGSKVLSPASGSFLGRRLLWEYLFSQWESGTKLLGLGGGYVSKVIVTQGFVTGAGDAHNDYLKLLIEYGPLAPALLICFFVSLMIFAVRRGMPALLAATAFIATASVTENVISSYLYTYVPLGMIWCVEMSRLAISSRLQGEPSAGESERVGLTQSRSLPQRPGVPK